MGGKHKQRTKGNTRPSSSSRCAERLMETGAAGTASLFGLGVSSGDAVGIFAGTSKVTSTGDPVSEMDILTVDADCRLLMKKMSKKDTTTKLKALLEFKEFSENASETILKGVLPFWPRLFNKLSCDYDRRVREATHSANCQLILQMKRNLAPHLKSIIGNLLMGQCDPYVLAASAAKAAFQAAFTPAKQVEALLFCKDEIMNHFYDTVYNQSPQTVTELELAPPEEAEATCDRLVSVALKTFAEFLAKIPSTKCHLLEEKCERFVTNSKFWRFSKNPASNIRGAWFLLISSICQSLPNLFQSRLNHLCPLVLGNLDEEDPAVCSFVWEATLHVLVSQKDAWNYVNASKVVFPKLSSISKKGFVGNSCAVCPNLLPFLSQIPNDILISVETFYSGFFMNMRLGLAVTRVQQSHADSSAIVTAFVECMNYVTKINPQLLEDLIVCHLLPVVESSIIEKDSVLSSTSLYSAVSTFWKRQEDRVKRLFWVTLTPACLSVLDSCDSEDTRSLERLANFLASFSSASENHGGDSPPNRVRFEKLQEVREVATCLRDALTSGSEFFGTDCGMEPVVSSLCLSAQGVYCSDHSVAHLKFLLKMLSSFVCKDLMKCLLEGSERSDDGLQILAAAYFDRFVCGTWLKNLRKRHCDAESDLQSEAVVLVHMTFLLLKLSDGKGRRHILDAVCQLNDVVIIEEMVRLLMQEMPKELFVIQWLKGEDFNVVIVDFTKSLVASVLSSAKTNPAEASATWRLLSHCVSVHDGEPAVSLECLSSILEVLHLALLDSMCEDSSDFTKAMEETLFFICNLTTSIFSCSPSSWEMPVCEDLLFAFFVLCCRPVMNTLSVRSVIDDLLAKGAQQLVIKHSSPMSPGTFLHKAAVHLHSSLMNAKELSPNCLDCLSKVVTSLLLSICRASVDDLSPPETIIQFVNTAFLSKADLEEIEVCLVCRNCTEQVMQGDVTILNRSASSAHSDSDADKSCANLTAMVYVTVDCLLGIMPFLGGNDECVEKLTPHFLAVLFSATYSEFVLGTKHDLVYSDDLVNWNVRLHKDLRKILEQFPEAGRVVLHSRCRELAMERGSLWSSAFIRLTRVLDAFGSFDRGDLLKIPAVLESEGSLHTFQLAFAAFNVRASDVRAFLERLDFAADARYIAIVAAGLRHLQSDSEDVASIVSSAIDALIEWKTTADASSKTYLFKVEIPNDWNVVCWNVECCKLLAAAVRYHELVLCPRHWDFIMCSLVSWLESCLRSQNQFKSQMETQALACYVFRLVDVVASAIERRRPGEQAALALITEWDEFFAERVYVPLLRLFVDQAHRMNHDKQNCIALEYVIESLSKVMTWLPLTVVQKNTLPAFLNLDWDDDVDHIPVNVRTLLNYLCPMLGSSKRSIQLGAYHVLERVAMLLPQYNKDRASKEDEDEYGLAFPGAIMSTLSHSQTMVEDILSDVQLCNLFVVAPDSKFHLVATGFLLVWHVVLQVFRNSTVESRSLYATFFRQSELVASLLDSVFRLMPSTAVLERSLEAHGSPGRGGFKAPTMFSKPPPLNPEVPWTPSDIQHLACATYFAALRHIPALVREWYNGLDRRTAPLVEKFTTSNVSPLLCAQDLATVQCADKEKLVGMKVKTRQTSREVVANCSFEEIKFEVVVKLSESHPLGAITIETGRPVGVSSQQWSYWTLQLTTFLMHQNGSILDGLLLWKRNIDKKFEGVQECYICFYVLHTSTCQLPRLVCRTCKKKFHPSCLYKWFSTSGHSKCPLCRSMF